MHDRTGYCPYLATHLWLMSYSHTQWSRFRFCCVCVVYRCLRALFLMSSLHYIIYTHFVQAPVKESCCYILTLIYGCGSPATMRTYVRLPMCCVVFLRTSVVCSSVVHALTCVVFNFQLDISQCDACRSSHCKFVMHICCQGVYLYL